jgi:hypothetical protein
MIQVIKLAMDCRPISTETEPVQNELAIWEFLKDKLIKLYPDDMETALSYFEVIFRASCAAPKVSVKFLHSIARFWRRTFFITEKG